MFFFQFFVYDNNIMIIYQYQLRQSFVAYFQILPTFIGENYIDFKLSACYYTSREKKINNIDQTETTFISVIVCELDMTIRGDTN
jgi:hypothetical protein